MKVKELMEVLKQFPDDAEIFYLDTWYKSEGWGENSEWNPIEDIKYNIEDNSIELL